MHKRYLIPLLLLSPLLLTSCGISENIIADTMDNAKQEIENKLNDTVQETLTEALNGVTPSSSATPTDPASPNLSTGNTSAPLYQLPATHMNIQYVQTLTDATVTGTGYIGWEGDKCEADITFTVLPTRTLDETTTPQNQEKTTIQFKKNLTSPAYTSTNNKEWTDTRNLTAPNPNLYTPITIIPNGNPNQQNLCSLPMWEQLTDQTENPYTWNSQKYSTYITNSINSWIAGMLPPGDTALPEGTLQPLEDLLKQNLPDSQMNPTATISPILEELTPLNINNEEKQTTYTLGGNETAAPIITITLTPTEDQEILPPAPGDIINNYSLSSIPGLENLPDLSQLGDLSNLNLDGIQKLLTDSNIDLNIFLQ